MQTIITPSIKDKILFFFCTEAIPEQFSQAKTNDVLQELELDFATFNAVMVQFERFGLIEDLNMMKSDFSFTLRTEAHDYAQKGGFVAQEEIFRSNIEKLILEVENLKTKLPADLLGTADKISSITSAIFAGLTLFAK